MISPPTPEEILDPSLNFRIYLEYTNTPQDSPVGCGRPPHDLEIHFYTH